MKNRTVVLVLAVLLLCGGCVPTTDNPPQKRDRDTISLAEAQLGLLSGHLSELERERVLTLMDSLVPLRRARLEEGRHQKSAEEARLVAQLNSLYERLTARYLGDGMDWVYENPPERELARFLVEEDGRLRGDPAFSPDREGPYTEEELHDLWDQMQGMLPQGAFAQFDRFTVFTDGVNETLAYVIPTDDAGTRWEIAVDPADADDGAWFTETVLHEYTHYLTLNDTQADYDGTPTAATYCEGYFVTYPGAYLDDFYHAFWRDTLDDRLASPNSYRFFLRHQEDFVTDYAATNPAEDIAESFTYYLLWDAPMGGAVWEQKLTFFYAYPELEEFRVQVRAQLGLTP